MGACPRRSPYETALLDWLGCAVRGAEEPAARAAAAAGAGLLERVAALGAAGHVLDFDDTYLPGIAHLSAPVAPAALALAADLGATVGDALDAYAAGFEAMGALARSSHPGLYDRGFHPTAVCGAAGAAVAAARLLGAPEDAAVAIALLRAGGLRAAFGSDGKALQVGLAAAAGVQAARLAAAGATVPRARVAAAWAEAYGGSLATPGPPAVDQNWIKAWPCCLQTHGAIECALSLDAPPDGRITVRAHPVSRQAAGYDDVATPLQAKFSIPYLAAYALLHGEPRVESFTAIDPAARELAAGIAVETDPGLAESEFVLLVGSDEVAHVRAARGSPDNPLTDDQLADKLHALAGTRLDGALDDPAVPADELL
ncbi:MAG TPA: MmgE/PrpD family protein, partial [Thermomicrobiales bacterium]|nr:MmgE/PrpD family protein [Thermomicrobiales bacterium]